MNMWPSWAAFGRAHMILPPSINGFWENQSFHNYADYAMSVGFQSGLARLREIGSVRRCAVMCAETVWWRCHRRIIADYLLTAGEQVFHILGPGKIVPASLTKVARPLPDGVLIYPAEAQTEQTEEMLTYEVSDEALESAAGAGNETMANYTLVYCTALDLCPGP